MKFHALHRRCALGVFLALLGTLPLVSGDPVGEGICVSWNATVRILFVGDEGASGKSCMGRLGLEKKGDGLASVVLTVAPDSFDSGEERRDEEVADLLGGPEGKALVFTSEGLESPGPGASFPKSLRGTLQVRGVSHGVTLEIQEIEGRIQVHTEVSLRALGIEAPKLAWGLVGEVRDSLVLKGEVPRPTLERLWTSGL